MDHREERMQSEAEWRLTERLVVQPILRLSEGRGWSEEDVQRCIGITRVNGVSCSARISSSGSDDEQGEVRMLYPSLSIFSHTCSPNTQAVNTADYGMALRATRDVKAGE